MSAVQLNFTLRTSANCKSAHLVGSWDNYNGKLPLSKDSAKVGGWKGIFRFQSTTLKQGQRYWYYYIIDGYHVSHDPARPHVVEPTTGRKLNTLDIPAAKATAAATESSDSKRSSRRVSRSTKEGVRGRALSPARIQCPKPQRAHAITRGEYNAPTVEALAAQFAAQQIDEDDESDSDDSSDDESDVPSLSSRSSNSSTPSSVSSVSSSCTCERYGITRAGNRVKLDCGGSRCSDSCDSESCSSESESEYRTRSTRRHGMVVRK
ncbi:hypothetical protein K431DRAFT_226462 [Polychaeton citri CBS 116435]|uniref:AMP-activated protein kinase glycogen-binding domain-containing protein n=1 Tax=Polychaeton citri CBS 116435 TaxID=1314669 RepID=A0A9P4UPW6_9PEZI|nr:hypothetical protein K431DRAFT_226462 [Polychaeton citri CBS 116435]